MPAPTGYDDGRQAIETFFQDAWNALGPAATGPAPIQFPNVRFQQPTTDPWGRFSILDFESTQRSLGTKPCVALPGRIVMQFFVKEDSGTQVIRALVDQFLEIFKTADGRAVEITPVGDSGRIRTEQGWGAPDDEPRDGKYQMRAIVPYVRDIRAT